MNIEKIYFNTSHVTVYPNIMHVSYFLSYISIHLMLLFITSLAMDMLTDNDFNTSHVTVYPDERIFFQINSHISIHLMLLFIFQIVLHCFSHSIISIHLMLLFIIEEEIQHTEKIIFQYISCYCLSRTTADEAQKLFHFNTSHVTVYPD